MGIFSRLSDIVNSNISSMLERAENPEKIVRLIIQEMEDTMVEVRSSAAKSLAERGDLERRIRQMEATVGDWRRKAELAVEKGREDLAKAALVAKNRALESVSALREELSSIDEGLAKTDNDLTKLQAKLDEAKKRQQAILVRRRTAGDRLKVRQRTHDSRIDDALNRYDEIERKLSGVEGQVDAYDMGQRKPGQDSKDQVESLESELEKLENESVVEKELAELRDQVRGRSQGERG
jgi:phage shock protein A